MDLLMNELKSHLLDSFKTEIKTPNSLAACLNAHGLYHIGQFVLRLSPVNHRLVNSAASKQEKDITWDEIQAYSTYIHETVHWWQHIGSTCGFILSMCYPAQSHVNIGHLRDIIAKDEAGKPIKKWSDQQMIRGRGPSEPIVAIANVISNNTLDLDYYRAIVMSPKLLHEIVEQNHFESVGHTFYIAYACCIGVLLTTFGEDLNVLPNADNWQKIISDLKDKKIGNYHWKSNVIMPPISGVSILEGQARFIQLQFLHFSAPDSTLSEYGARGYLDGVYGEAFKYFVQTTKSEFPASIDDPLIGLFLLVCDIALNPGEGFPFEISNFENFALHAQPAIRFALMCDVISERHAHLKEYIKDYSKEEYIFVADQLTKACGYHHPIEISKELVNWSTSDSTLKKLMKENTTFAFREENLPVRVIFSEFLKFNSYKINYPEFFCWTGRHKVSTNAETYLDPWLKNLSLFSDKEDDEGIYPRMQPGKKNEDIHKTFSIFYGNLVQYDLIRQLIIQNGPFKYDFSWLTGKLSSQEVEAKAKDTFKNLFGLSPDEIKIINDGIANS